MLTWISAYYGDIIVLAVLGMIVGGILGSMFRRKRKGQSCGCGSCKGCSMAGSCHMHLK